MTLPYILLVAAACLSLLGFVLFLAARTQRRRSGLPSFKVVYADTGMWNRVEKPLYDARAGLTGKPDYLVKHKGAWIPVEVKSGGTPAQPREAHVLQLAAYCLLVERATGKRPPHGLVHYPEQTFQVAYTPEMEAQLIRQIELIRRHERSIPGRSHESKGRCAGCGYSEICDQKL